MVSLRKSTGLRGSSVIWGAAWALLLAGDFAGAEAFLQRACQERGPEATLLTLLAFCQSRRGKLQSAILNARQACTPRPPNNEHAKLLIDLLLEGGYTREASQRLRELEPDLKKDTDLLFSMVWLNVMLRKFEEAEQWTGLMQQGSAGAHTLVRLGQIYETARKADQAGAFYRQALEKGYYPEAYLGLGRLEASRLNKEQAREHFMAALDTHRAPGERAVGTLQLLRLIIHQILALEEPVLNCQAWFATLPANVSPQALAGKSFMVVAPDKQQAGQRLGAILNAMQPGSPPLPDSAFRWRKAPKEQQPDGPARPGVQGISG
jgi:tetratricopeptide (TPR) repeat protein